MLPKKLTDCLCVPIKNFLSKKSPHQRLFQALMILGLAKIGHTISEEVMKKPFQVVLDKKRQYVLVGDKESLKAADRGVLQELRGIKFWKKISNKITQPSNLSKVIDEQDDDINLMFCFTVEPNISEIPSISSKQSMKIKEKSVVLIKKYKDKEEDILRSVETLKTVFHTPVLTYADYVNFLAVLSVLITISSFLLRNQFVKQVQNKLTRVKPLNK